MCTCTDLSSLAVTLLEVRECSWWSWWHGTACAFPGVTRKQPCSYLFPGWVLNSRFRQDVRSLKSLWVSQCFMGSLDRFFMWDQDMCSLGHVRHISTCKYKTEPTSVLKPVEMSSSSCWRPNYLPSTGPGPPLPGSRQLPPQTQILETSPALNCSDFSLPAGPWLRCLSWALSERQRS